MLAPRVLATGVLAFIQADGQGKNNPKGSRILQGPNLELMRYGMVRAAFAVHHYTTAVGKGEGHLHTQRGGGGYSTATDPRRR